MWINPTSDAIPYFSVDKFNIEPAVARLYYMGVPRDASFNQLKTNAYPVIHGSMHITATSGCTGTSTYFFHAMMFKFVTGEPDMYYIPLSLSGDYIARSYHLFLKTTRSGTDMTLDGTSNSYVSFIESYLDHWCTTGQRTYVYTAFGTGVRAITN